MMRIEFTRLVGAALFVPLAAVACGGSIAPPSGDTPDGVAPSPAGCIDNGVSRPVGSTWRCSDGCNTCGCDDGGATWSTTIACGAAPGDPGHGPIATCDDNGISRPVGSTWPCGCNTCGCDDGGTTWSTAVACGSIATCNDNGISHPVGSTWPCGCNTCGCDDGGTSWSTTIACGPTSPADAGAGCSLLGAWHTHSAPWNGMSTDAVITFNADGTLTGNPMFTGTYSYDGSTLRILTTSGPDMNCGYTDTWTVSFGADCSTAPLQPVGSGCTGARRYLDWNVTLTRQ